MTALSAHASPAASSKSGGPDVKRFLAADSLNFYNGGLVMLDSAGLLRPAAALAANNGVIGVAELDASSVGASALASGTGGATWVNVRRGAYKMTGANLVQAGVGKNHFAVDDATIDATPATENAPHGPRLLEYISATSGWFLLGWDSVKQPTPGNYTTGAVLANIADGDLLTTWTPGFAGILKSLSAHVKVAVTTGAKASSLNVEIGTTNATGTLAMTSANLTPIGAVITQALSVGTYFTATDTISIEAASTTTFIEGEINIVLGYETFA
jgi:hypothetical protein